MSQKESKHLGRYNNMSRARLRALIMDTLRYDNQYPLRQTQVLRYRVQSYH